MVERVQQPQRSSRSEDFRSSASIELASAHGLRGCTERGSIRSAMRNKVGTVIKWSLDRAASLAHSIAYSTRGV